ncbi:hypothetical protein RIR_jg28919.t1 [Rhizophagus irregularis DAOM 181602=DAOM 197198]|uniref:Uncharacterized protein n=1 Tax=Rhizophagus irregularis (strain DAOM 197198w) TaxID=1432141 RepID=A0A015J425_RHIIW|nr:hypothetical protein RirG_144840 [Rhizophagus irregularis DAOM 197198w]GBC36678.2 hypothetical protein RIR_jg28919.t1 [Rhizophagus irregularis DAOM 181602=DAOM 197198]
MNSSFRFLGVWFNVVSSRDFVKKQVARECNSFAATVRPAKLFAKQVVYMHNTVLIPNWNIVCKSLTSLNLNVPRQPAVSVLWLNIRPTSHACSLTLYCFCLKAWD